MFGGFSGVLLNDVLVYRPPSCRAFLLEEGCVEAGLGVRCIWSRGHCVPWEPSMANRSLSPAPFCPPKPGENDATARKKNLLNLMTGFVLVVLVQISCSLVFPCLVTVDERCYRFSDCASCTANTNGCQWCDDKKCIAASSNCSSVSGPTGGARGLSKFAGSAATKIVSDKVFFFFFFFHKAQVQN